ncbi:hypothetical protein CA85_41470 [Allorhodopirellula solitaria]|uniref:Uncharacterized protein n=1 Tax=Allorhodopirellula solitaria TaxID=2527987 RepID=A0A5C5X356_9BACT|nr:hypothetical protein CA85_41470 [Allorhodopirellula solitaria]
MTQTRSRYLGGKREREEASGLGQVKIRVGCRRQGNELSVTHKFAHAEGVLENSRWFEHKRTPPDTTRNARANPEWGGRSFMTRSATHFGVDVR